MSDFSTTETHGSGQSVNIVVTGASLKWWLIPIALLMFASFGLGLSANLKANQAIKVSEDQQTESRMVQFWVRAAKLSCDSKGLDTPKLPANY